MRNIYRGHFTKGETIWPIARVPLPDGTLLVRGGVSNGTSTKGTGYDRYVYDLTAGTRASAPATAIMTTEGGDEEDVMEVGPAETNDDWWKGGGAGYSFRDINGVDLASPVGGHTYRIVYLLNTNSFGQIPLVFDMTCDGHEAAVS